MNTPTDPQKCDRWARLRFSIIGPLLAAPPAPKMLYASLQVLAAKSWRHPVSGMDVRFAASTMERWYYTARRANDPVAALKDRLRGDVSRFPSLTPPVIDTLIGHYAYHETHEQFHSEIKTDLDMERLPSGKFATNDAMLHLGMFAYNCLRLIGQLGLTGDISPVKHPAKRRRIRAVLQEVMYRAAQFIAKARKLILDFGALAAHIVPVFVHVQGRLLAARSP